jgi:hypothetical protein
LSKTARVLLAGALTSALAFALRDSQPWLAASLSAILYGAALLSLRALDSTHWTLIRQMLSALPFFGKYLARLWQPLSAP